MQLHLNGSLQQFENIQNVLDLIQQLHLENKKMAVELNQAIVPKSLYAQTLLKEGDVVEIVVAVGGG